MSTGEDFLSCLASYLRPGGRQDRTKTKNASSLTGQDRTPGPSVLCSALMSIFFVLSCFLPSSWQAAGQDKNQKRVLSYRTGQDTRAACPVLSSDEHFFVLSCPVLFPTFVLAGGRTRQDKNQKRVLSYRTGQDTRAACPVLSSDEHFFVLFCPVLLPPFVLAGGRTGHQNRLSCAQHCVALTIVETDDANCFYCDGFTFVSTTQWSQFIKVLIISTVDETFVQ